MTLPEALARVVRRRPADPRWRWSGAHLQVGDALLVSWHTCVVCRRPLSDRTPGGRPGRQTGVCAPCEAGSSDGVLNVLLFNARQADAEAFTRWCELVAAKVRAEERSGCGA